jgi:hypothetical protein
MTVSSQKLANVTKKGLTARYTCKAACAMSATLTVSSSTAKKLRIPRTLAKATGANGGTITLKLSKTTLKRLKKVKSVSTTLDVELTNGVVSEDYSDDVTIRR